MRKELARPGEATVRSLSAPGKFKSARLANEHDEPWSSSLLPTEEGHGGGLLHPRGSQALVEIIHGCELDATRGLAHPDGSHRRFRLELDAAYEHQFHMADEGVGREAPASAHTVGTRYPTSLHAGGPIGARPPGHRCARRCRAAAAASWRCRRTRARCLPRPSRGLLCPSWRPAAWRSWRWQSWQTS